jgi:hypothetical protein
MNLKPFIKAAVFYHKGEPVESEMNFLFTFCPKGEPLRIKGSKEIGFAPSF